MADPRAEHRDRAAPARRRVRLRSRGDGDHAQRQRSAADRAARHRPEGRATKSSPPTRTTGGCSTPGTSASRRDGITVRKISFPVPPPSMDDLADRLISRDRAEDEGPPLLPHHESDRADLPGEEDLRRGARERREDDRRRRARVRALPLQGVGPRLRLLRHQPAQVAARADRHRVPLRAAREHRVAVGTDADRRESRAKDIRKFEEIGTHPAANHNAIAEALSFHDGMGIERKAARLRYLRNRWASAAAADRPLQDPHQPWIRRSRAPSAPCRCSACRPARRSQQLWDKWRIIATPIVHAEYAGHPRHAERLHDARRDRHVRECDGKSSAGS